MGKKAYEAWLERRPMEDPDRNWQTRQERDRLARADTKRRHDRAERIVWTLLTAFALVLLCAVVLVPVVIYLGRG